MNIFKQRLVNKGVGGEGWEGYGVDSSHSLRDYFITHKIYSDTEIHYCNTNSKPYIHLSGKYAAKEAIKKALLSKRIVKSISLKKIVLSEIVFHL